MKNILKNLKIPAIAFLLAIIVSGIIILFSGFNPFEVFAAMFKGAFSNKTSIARTLAQATPLILTGLAFAVAKKASLINLGVEGQLYVGAFATVMVALLDIPIPPFFHTLLAIIAGSIAGGLYGALVGFLKVKYGANEVISTIMLNSIAILVINYLVSYPFKDPNSSIGQTAKIDDSLRLTALVSKTQLTTAFILAILLCFLMKFIIDKTVLGYNIRSVGFNKKASEVAGINVGKTAIVSMFLSGAIAGIVGSIYVMGVNGRVIADFSTGVGFSGIAVSALAADNIIGIIFSGVIFGAVSSGTMLLDLTTDVPLAFADLIQSLVIIFVAAPMLIESILHFKISDKLKNANFGKEGN